MVTYADRPWLKHYPAGVPASLKPYPDMTIPDYLRQTAKRVPKNPALVTSVRLPVVGHQAHTMTYGELDHDSDILAAALIDLGLEKGQTVILCMPNTTNFIISYYAILKAGGVVCALNPAYPAQKLGKLADEADAVMVLTLTNLYSTFKEIQYRTKVKHIIVSNIKEYFHRLVRIAFTRTQEKPGGHYLAKVEVGDYWLQDLLKKYKKKKPEVEITPDDIAVMQFTGGTTGDPKGALASHRALCASTQQIESWIDVDWPKGSMPPMEKRVVLAMLPMFHVYGLIVLVHQATNAGWKIILVPDPRDMNHVVDLIDVYKPHITLGVPMMFHAIGTHPRMVNGEVNMKHSKITICGAAPLHPSITEAMRHTGAEVREGYGLSEVPAGNHCNPIIGQPNRDNSVGIPMIDVDCRVMDIATGTQEVPVGEVGEIILNAPNLMEGYYKQPEETANVLREHDGKLWVYTGDVGYMDEDGYFYLVDRKKDMALIGGFNVYPGPVEKILKSHPDVIDAGVWYIPHPRVEGQEALQAWVVARPGTDVKKGDLINHCKPYLAPYEIPRRFEFVDELPYSDAGKLLRRKLPEIKASRRRRSQAEVEPTEASA
ncbi:AMP-binding protein [Phototrophicus methaneseepsis]|uniref:AMP-binding protein n=1 Tax=Phototrophicus methaneseepsis TaxID=2710758 RepID=A0A7S8IEL6_9CHLR|nr:AMP-binding protein [Phototrophicus methaneseepsis]QPC81943.1 AMP-binding protein [Phototrophicus methaneseepsis]